MRFLVLTKRLLLSALVLTVVAAGGLLLIRRSTAFDAEGAAVTLVSPLAQSDAVRVADSFNISASIIRFLSQAPDVQAMLRSDQAGGVAPLTSETYDRFATNAAETFVAVVADGRFSTIQLIDRDGLERIKVTWEDGRAVRRPDTELKNESHEDYFQVPRDTFQAGGLIQFAACAGERRRGGSRATCRFAPDLNRRVGRFWSVRRRRCGDRANNADL